MANTFDWLEIRTRDITRAARFYGEVFGWQVVQQELQEGSDYWIFDTGDTPRLENIRRGGMWLRPAGADLRVVPYIFVLDIEEVLARVTALGGRILPPGPPRALPSGPTSPTPMATC